ncbi:MAG: hypothetical protein JST19_06770 [Bacteroidetes bacterium]|nr:hypothetical protein [Bacteroidota bacterium]
MDLVGQIINDLVNNDTPLSNALNKTKVLASRIGQDDLLTWANNELAGYPGKAKLPHYRECRGNITIDYVDRYRRGKHFPLTVDFDPEETKTFETASFYESVSRLESMIASKNNMIRYEFPSTSRHILQQMLQQVNGPHFQLTSAGISLPIGFVHEILAAVRQRLLDFMLELERQFGSEVEISTLKDNKQTINQYMNTTINNNGDGNVVNTGSNSTIHAHIEISKGDKKDLANDLIKRGINESDISDLLTFIDEEKPTSDGKFSKQVNTWIGRMINKAVDGSWEIGIATAGGVLAEAIAKYYGIH